MSNLHTVFSFDSARVRVVTTEGGNPWFVACDVCAVLDFSNPSETLKRLDEDDLSSIEVIDTLGRAQQTTIINESGLYALLLGSRKPEAKRFKRWVTAEVLPSIRKTGGYSLPEPQTQNQPITKGLEAAGELAFWDAAAKSLNLAPSSHLNGVRKIAAAYSLATLDVLPFYTIDAPVDETSETTSHKDLSAEPVSAASILLKKHRPDLTSVRFNKLLVEAGILEVVERNSTKAGNETQIKEYKSVTAKGLKFGKNVIANVNAKETQPLWYRSRFVDLLKEVGL